MSKSVQPPWSRCNYCPKTEFSSSILFAKHLRQEHCSQEGGSFVCHYGENNVCYSLPVEGVNDADYERHVHQNHMWGMHSQGVNSKNCSTFPADRPGGSGDKWTVYSASQFLPSVLNDPNKGKQRDFFTKTWGDNFVEHTVIPEPSYLPRITLSHFEHYLKKLGKKHKKHLKLSLISSKPGNADLLQNFPNLKLGKFNERHQVNINAIPKIFLNPTFELNNVDTFNTVFPHISESASNDLNPKNNLSEPSAKNSAKLLQEKLTHYLDMVEVQIAEQVAHKSEALFHAMTSHDVLMDQLTHNITVVKTLREKIQKVDEDLAKKSLSIIKSERRRANTWQVYKKLKVMSTVMQTQPTIQLLLSSPDYVGALDVIHTTQLLLSTELAGIHSFRHLSCELSEMLKVIDTLMSEELERYSTADLNRPFTEPNTLDQDKLWCIVVGLVRRGEYRFVEVYKREVEAAVKAGVKAAAIEVVARSSHHTTDAAPLDDTLKTLSVAEWLSLMQTAATFTIALLTRLKHVHDVMISTVNMCAGLDQENSDNALIMGEVGEWQLTKEEHSKVSDKIHSLLVYGCEYTQDTCAQLLTTRTLRPAEESNESSAGAGGWLAERANPAQLKQLAVYVDSICSHCLTICPFRYVNSLKSAFTIQATKFLSRFHSEKVQKLTFILDSEPWRQTDVPASFQQLVDHIAEKGKFHVSKEEVESLKNSGMPRTNTYLVIGGEKYAVVGTVLLLVDIVSEYCVYGREVPWGGGALLRHLADLLLQYNSRCYRLMLAGEAVSQRTGLRKITTTNLALLLRALHLLLWLLPHVKIHFASLVEESLVKSQLDGVGERLKEHARDVHAKLLDIMHNLIVSEIKYWEPKPPVPSKSVQAISKHLRKLHEAISGVLPRSYLQELLKGVTVLYKEALADKLSRYNITTDVGPQHGVVTSEYLFYLEELKRLKALDVEELDKLAVCDVWSMARS